MKIGTWNFVFIKGVLLIERWNGDRKNRDIVINKFKQELILVLFIVPVALFFFWWYVKATYLNPAPKAQANPAQQVQQQAKRVEQQPAQPTQATQEKRRYYINQKDVRIKKVY